MAQRKCGTNSPINNREKIGAVQITIHHFSSLFITFNYFSSLFITFHHFSSLLSLFITFHHFPSLFLFVVNLHIHYTVHSYTLRTENQTYTAIFHHLSSLFIPFATYTVYNYTLRTGNQTYTAVFHAEVQSTK